jgi:GNAT superfamily N-acetyltransferase
VERSPLADACPGLAAFTDAAATLELFMQDYVVHLEHNPTQLLDESATATIISSTSAVKLRIATHADIPQLESLISASVRALSVGFYSQAQIEASLIAVFGIDTQLIADGTYYVIGGASGPVAAGGWSGRSTLYGGDQFKGAEDARLDPERDAARIRAFFVHPDHTRRGLARALYAQCATSALAAGFRRFELMATLPGEPLYAALGFVATERIALPLGDDLRLPLVRMSRDIES